MEDYNQTVLDMISKVSGNQTLQSAIVKCSEVLPQYHNIKVSVSGGADSDIVVDMVTKIGNTDDLKFVWFNTGLEFKATRDHLDYLENKYGIKIERIIPEKSYGMKRTGCGGCPFNRHFLKELDILERYEPTLWKACWNVFGDSYRHMISYRKFQDKMAGK